jgi:hypothetical protein
MKEKMKMVKKGGKMVPSFAADGVGKMKMGGMADKSGRAMKKSSSDAKGRAMHKMPDGSMMPGAKHKMKMGGSVMKKGK